MTSPTPTPMGARPSATPSAAPSQLSIGATIWLRAVTDKSTVIGVIAGYALALGVGVGALWPPLRDVFADIQLPAAFDGLLGGLPLDSPEGWVNAELLSMMAPGFLIAAAVVSAGAATAGEEQGRTLGLTLAAGAGRSTFLAAKTAAVLTHVLVVAAGVFFGMLAGSAIGDMGLGVGPLLDATGWAVLVAVMYAAIALTVGALTGDKRLATAVTGGIAAVSFVLSVFLPLSESLQGWAKVNLWYPYSGNVAIANGIDAGLAAVMLVIAVGVLVVGFTGFRRRRVLRG